MRRRTGRKHRETALKILSRRKPPGNVTRLATAVEGPRNKSFAHVLSLHFLCVHVFTIRFSFFLHYAPSFVPLQGTSFGLASPSAPSPCNGEGWGEASLPVPISRSLLQFLCFLFSGFDDFFLECCLQVRQAIVTITWENIGILLEVREHGIQPAGSIEQRLNSHHRARQDSAQFLRNTFVK